MGFDLVTWAPAIGGGGDNNYNVPGATKLDGSFDSANNQTIVIPGDASGFSATPTIPQINASSHFNQVAGAYNRRARTYNSAFWTSLPTVPYPASGTKITASDLTTLLANINTLRTQEGWTGGALTWPITTPASGGLIMGHHLAFLRKALAISGTLSRAMTTQTIIDFPSLVPGNVGVYSRDDNPYNTHIAESSNGLFAGAFRCGKVCPNSVNIYRSRLLIPVNIPEWSANILGATLTLDIVNVVTTLEQMRFAIWGNNPAANDSNPPKLTPAYNGTAYDLWEAIDITAHLPSVGVSAYTLGSVGAFTPANISHHAGKRMILILGQSNELGNGGAGISAGNHSYFDLNFPSSKHHFDITF